MNGYLTRYLDKFLGFKGLAFILATVAMFLGKLSGADWATVAMACSGLKVAEDIGRGYLEKRFSNLDLS